MEPHLTFLNHLAIRVQDLELNAQFYRDVLGLDMTSYDGQHAFFDCGGMEFVLIQDPRRRDCFGQLAHIGFKVEDPSVLDHYAQVLASAGCPNIDGPRSTPAGGRTMYFTDPEGTVIEIYC